MALSTTTTNSGNLPAEYYNRRALTTLQPRLQVTALGKEAPLPDHNGTLAKWRIYTRIGSNTTPLTEGVPPSARAVTISNITKSVAQYGDYAKVTDLLELTGVSNSKDEFADLFGVAAAETAEDLTITELDATLTVRRVNGRGSDAALVVTDVPTLKEFLKAQIALKNSYVGPHERGRRYQCVLHPNTEYDIRAEANQFSMQDISSFQGVDKKMLLRDTFLDVMGMTFMTSDKMNTTASTQTLTHNFVIGQECFGVVKLGGRNFQIIMKGRTEGGPANPLNQWSTVGWKMEGFAVKNFAAARGILLKGVTSFA